MIIGVTILVFAAFTGPSGSPKVANLPGQTSSAALTKIKITAVKGDSTVDVREGGVNGNPIFGGTLVKGHSKTVSGSSLWIQVGAIQNLRWTMGGITFPAGNKVGPAVILFTPKGHKFLHG